MEDLQRELLLAEYAVLNTDVQQRLSYRFYLSFGVLTAIVSLISVSGIPAEVLLLFPWAVWLVSLWILHNEISIKRKNTYIREIEAEHFPEGQGFLRWKNTITTPLLSTKGLNIETVINRILLGCDAGSVAVGAYRLTATSTPSLLDLSVSGVLLLAALFAVGLTARNDFARRERRLKKKGSSNMVTIQQTSNQFEDGVIITCDYGTRIEAVVTHLPGESSTFTLAKATIDEDGNPIITKIFTRPIN